MQPDGQPKSPRTIQLGDCIIKDGKLFRPNKTEFYTCWEEMEVGDPQEPVCTWNGGKIPFSIIEQCVSFFRDGYKETNSENLLFLYYNPDSKDWYAWAPPQSCIGMTVKCKEDSKEYKEQRALIPPGYILLGTIHHHCGMAAFCSGTDESDELDKEGLHITIGSLGKDKLTWHFRALFEGTLQDTSRESWIADPCWLLHVPETMRKAVVERCYDNPAKTEYPPQWLKNCEKGTFSWFSGKASPRELDFYDDYTVTSFPNKNKKLPEHIENLIWTIALAEGAKGIEELHSLLILHYNSSVGTFIEDFELRICTIAELVKYKKDMVKNQELDPMDKIATLKELFEYFKGVPVKEQEDILFKYLQ